jgi:two-component system, chemotaxis family, protein-glutamate methylesterase/glutaminase
MFDRYDLDRPTTITCPGCGGALSFAPDGSLVRYKCHIGHELTAATLLHAQHRTLEEGLCRLLSLFNERAELCRQMGEASGSMPVFEAARREALERAAVVRSLLEGEWTLPELER